MSDTAHNASAETAPLPSLIDAKAAAAALSIGVRLLWTITANGDLASVRIGRRVLYDPRDLAEFVERNRRERRA